MADGWKKLFDRPGRAIAPQARATRTTRLPSRAGQLTDASDSCSVHLSHTRAAGKHADGKIAPTAFEAWEPGATSGSDPAGDSDQRRSADQDDDGSGVGSFSQPSNEAEHPTSAARKIQTGSPSAETPLVGDLSPRLVESDSDAGSPIMIRSGKAAVQPATRQTDRTAKIANKVFGAGHAVGSYYSEQVVFSRPRTAVETTFGWAELREGSDDITGATYTECTAFVRTHFGDFIQLLGIREGSVVTAAVTQPAPFGVLIRVRVYHQRQSFSVKGVPFERSNLQDALDRFICCLPSGRRSVQVVELINNLPKCGGTGTSSVDQLAGLVAVAQAAGQGLNPVQINAFMVGANDSIALAGLGRNSIYATEDSTELSTAAPVPDMIVIPFHMPGAAINTKMLVGNRIETVAEAVKDRELWNRFCNACDTHNFVEFGCLVELSVERHREHYNDEPIDALVELAHRYDGFLTHSASGRAASIVLKLRASERGQRGFICAITDELHAMGATTLDPYRIVAGQPSVVSSPQTGGDA